MALSSAALTTLAKVKAILGITDASQDARLEALIESASAAAAKYCGRSFHREDGIEELVRGFSSVFLRVEKLPILAVDSVEFNDSAIDASAWSIDDANTGFLYAPNGWRWTAVNVGGITLVGLPGSEQKLYKVTYDGGYVTQNQVDLAEFVTRTLPFDLEEAICKMVTDVYQTQSRDSTIAAEKLLTGAVTYGTASVTMSASTKMVLDSYRVEIMA